MILIIEDALSLSRKTKIIEQIEFREQLIKELISTYKVKCMSEITQLKKKLSRM